MLVSTHYTELLIKKSSSENATKDVDPEQKQQLSHWFTDGLMCSLHIKSGWALWVEIGMARSRRGAQRGCKLSPFGIPSFCSSSTCLLSYFLLLSNLCPSRLFRVYYIIASYYQSEVRGIHPSHPTTLISWVHKAQKHFMLPPPFSTTCLDMEVGIPSSLSGLLSWPEWLHVLNDFIFCISLSMMR